MFFFNIIKSVKLIVLKLMKQKKQQSVNGHDSNLTNKIDPSIMYVTIINKHKVKGANILPVLLKFQSSSINMSLLSVKIEFGFICWPFVKLPPPPPPPPPPTEDDE